jgi:DNA-binding MarR family transcriptional regulator
LRSDGSGLHDEDYRRLFAFRTTLREFLHWSEGIAKDAGLAPTQHQLLLVIRADPDHLGPTIGDVAQSLFLRHHSVVELVDRAASAGLVHRVKDPNDARLVRLQLTRQGRQLLEQITLRHLAEVHRFEQTLKGLWSLGRPGGRHDRPAQRTRPSATPHTGAEPRFAKQTRR